MNREIKFRIFLKETKKIYQVETIQFNSRDSLPAFIKYKINDDIFEFCISSQCELMQYTGFKDKNRNEIYEGDILKKVDGYITGDTHLVERGIKICGPYDCIEEYEIIGNIYENPELLEVK